MGILVEFLTEPDFFLTWKFIKAENLKRFLVPFSWKLYIAHFINLKSG